MGCGASKSLSDQVVETTLPAPSPAPIIDAVVEATPIPAQPIQPVAVDEDEKKSRPVTPQILKEVVQTVNVECEVEEETGAAPSAEKIHETVVTKGANLTRTVIPSIIPYVSSTEAATGNHKAVAFEIPLDEDAVNVEGEPPVDPTAIQSKASISSVDTVKNAPVKVSLPKLALSEHDLQAKLANTEARWKDLEEAQAERRNHRRRGPKPTLTHTKKEVDPETLKRRLLEKEALASTNRAREITKLQTKLARQDEHLRRVQERKRALGRLSNEDLNLSWGGEDGEGKEGKEDVDSGKGSSAVSLSLGSRSGSGRSMGTNGEMVDDRNVVQVAPLPQRYSLAL